MRNYSGIALFLITLSTYTMADEIIEPKWELGIGVGAVAGPDYRGSDEYRSFISPIPYVIYRGKYIRSDRDGLRGNFLRTERYEFTLSASAAITPENDENILRHDMPELGSTMELGPSFNINLTGKDFTQGWQLQLPVRAVVALDADNSGYIGSLFNPQLIYRKKFTLWAFSYKAGLTFANRDYHDYYYSVAPQYVTATRSEFSARGGYSGWDNQMTFGRGFQYHDIKTRLAFFIRYDNLHNANFTASPLVATENSVRGGIAFIWVIK